MTAAGSRAPIPENVMDAVDRTSANLQQLETLLIQFISSCEEDTLAEMSPLERAQALFSLAKASSVLFALRLRSAGIDPDEHPIKTELDRLDLYEEKLERYANWIRAPPAQPSTTLNYRAAARFIGHSLTSLTPEQKNDIRNISQGKGSSTAGNVHKKRKKHAAHDHQSVRAAAQEFLEKAAQELLGPNRDSKGPIRAGSCSDDEAGPLVS